MGRCPVHCQKDVRRGVRRRHCSRVRWPRFPQLALRPHPSRHGSETASSHPAPMPKRRSERRSARRPGSANPRLQKIRIRNRCAGGQAATVAGYVGPGFHIWPSGHIPQDMAPKPMIRIRPHAKKTFGEAFGAATGVSDPRLQKIRIPNNGAGGKAAAVAGDDGPGFHTWPSGHIPQDTAPKPLLRSRSHAKNTFGETFGAATGVSDPRLQKIRIRNHGAGGEAATVAGYAGPGFHTWPSGHIPQDNGSEAVPRIRPPAKKTFGEAFGAATGVSDPRQQKIRIRKHGAGGKAATVAGVAGPGFHNWPAGHILREADAKAVIRIRRIRTCPEGVR